MLFRQRITFLMGCVCLGLAILFRAMRVPFGVVFLMGTMASWALGTWAYMWMGMPTVFPPTGIFIVWVGLCALTILAFLTGDRLFAMLFGIALLIAQFCKMRSHAQSRSA